MPAEAGTLSDFFRRACGPAAGPDPLLVRPRRRDEVRTAPPPAAAYELGRLLARERHRLALTPFRAFAGAGGAVPKPGRTVGRDLLPELLAALDVGAELLEEVRSHVDTLVLSTDDQEAGGAQASASFSYWRLGHTCGDSEPPSESVRGENRRAEMTNLLRQVAAAFTPPGPDEVGRGTAPVDAVAAALSDGLAREGGPLVPESLRLGLTVGRAEYPPWAWEACLLGERENLPEGESVPPGLRAALSRPGSFVGAAACEVTPRAGWWKDVNTALAAAGVTADIPGRPRLDPLPLGRRRLDADSAGRLHDWLSAVDAAAVGHLSALPEAEETVCDAAGAVPADDPPEDGRKAPSAAGGSAADDQNPLNDFDIGPFGLAVKLPNDSGGPAQIAREGLDRPPQIVTDLTGNIIYAVSEGGESGPGVATQAEVASAWAGAGRRDRHPSPNAVSNGLRRANAVLREFGLKIAPATRVYGGAMRELRELSDDG